MEGTEMSLGQVNPLALQEGQKNESGSEEHAHVSCGTVNKKAL